jgi:hypothetical protein
MYLLEEYERLQGIEKEAEDSTHNIRQVRKKNSTGYGPRELGLTQ